MAKYVQPLPLLGAGIVVASPSGGTRPLDPLATRVKTSAAPSAASWPKKRRRVIPIVGHLPVAGIQQITRSERRIGQGWGRPHSCDKRLHDREGHPQNA